MRAGIDVGLLAAIGIDGAASAAPRPANCSLGKSRARCEAQAF